MREGTEERGGLRREGEKREHLMDLDEEKVRHTDKRNTIAAIFFFPRRCSTLNQMQALYTVFTVRRLWGLCRCVK